MGVVRILLAVCVFYGHSGRPGNFHWLSPDLAVETFFVISGFYMQLILSTKYTRGKLGSAWWLQFYEARYFRLLPIYLIGFFLTIGVSLLRPSLAPLPIWDYVSTLSNTSANLLFKIFLILTNFTMFFQDAIMFLSAHNGQVVWSQDFLNSEMPLWQGLAIQQAWSLGVELNFYIIAPYLLNLRSRWLVLGACVGLTVKVIAIEGLNLGDPWTYRFFPFELGYFLLGAIAFRLRRLLEGPKLDRRISALCAYPLAMAIIVFSVPQLSIWYPLLIACLLPFLFQSTSKLTADRLIGELSYPFYIFHLLAFAIAGSLVQHWLHISEGSIAWVGLGLTLIFSAVALAVEMRFVEPWRIRFAERHIECEFDGHRHRVWLNSVNEHLGPYGRESSAERVTAQK